MTPRTLDCWSGLLLLAATPALLQAAPLQISGPTMGTTYHVKLVGAAASDENAFRAEIESVLRDVDRRLSTYRQDSEISRFNRGGAGQWLPVSSATAEVVAAALEVSGQSGGALDVTVGPLVRLWHFGPETIGDVQSVDEIVPPAPDALQAARQRVGYEQIDVRHDRPALRKQAAGLEIDLSAVGEGDAIDRIAAALLERGVERFLIELGGEVRAHGAAPGGRPWRVAVQQPADRQPPQAQAVVALVDAALATSGDYRRYFEHRGRRYSHLIDPPTGRPVNHSLASVTVAADQCRTADAWATALLVLGPERGYDCAVEHRIAALLLVGEEGGFVARPTPAWSARFSTETPAE